MKKYIVGCMLLLLFGFSIQKSLAQTITAAEFFYNTDPGVGNATPFTITNGSQINFTAAIPYGVGLPPGFNQLFIRFKDNLGNWSIAEQRGFYIDVATNTIRSKIVSGEYFFDTDPGTGAATAFAVTKTDSVNMLLSVTHANLSGGFHQLFIRLKDSTNKWSIAEQRAFYVEATATTSASKITMGEYFIDTDPGTGAATAFAVTKTDSVNTLLSLTHANLSGGFHQLFIRMKDSTNKWSIAEQRAFYVEASATTTASKITMGEYFIDTDPGTGAATAFAVAKTDSVNTLLSLTHANLSGGFHQLFIRMKDSTNKWSIAEQRAFYVDVNLIQSKSPLIAAEYFFSKDTGVNTGKPILFAKTDSLNKNLTIITANLALGNQYLLIRVKDSSGNWSIAESRKIKIICKPDLGHDTAVTICAGSVTNITGIYNYTGYAAAQWNTPTPTAVGGGVYRLIVTSSLGCSDTAFVTVNTNPKPNLGKDSTVKICAGSSVSLIPLYNTAGLTTHWNISRPDSVTAAGVDTLIVTNSFGCMDTALVTVIVNPLPTPTISPAGPIAICQGSSALLAVSQVYTSYLWSTTATTQQITVNSAGSYFVTVTDSNGCVGISAPAVVSVNPLVGAIVPIKGQAANLCGGGTNIKYTIDPVANATNYTWTVPANCTIASGQGTVSIRVNFPSNYNSGYVIVIASNGCGGTVPDSLKVIAKPGVPSKISGLKNVAANQAGLVYSVTATVGLTYTWSVPADAVITTGQGTNSIVVTWGTIPGIVSVFATNACGISGVKSLSVKLSSALAATHSGKIDIADADSKPLVYPNPAQNECTVVFNAAGKGKYTLEITDMNGKKVAIKRGAAFAGENKVKVDISQLANGIYLINLFDDEHGRRVLKLNKQ